MSSTSWRLNSSTIAGIFFSLNIVASVLALAIWDFQKHDTNHNVLYLGGVICSFLLNTAIAISLQMAIRQHRPNFFLPFIICAAIHLTISLGVVFLFTISLLDHMFKGSDLQDFYGVLVFTGMFFFWILSIHVVQKDRERIQKICGVHSLLPEYL
ncbi:unnamed protein product, partial [Mesorhabditis belari]